MLTLCFPMNNRNRTTQVPCENIRLLTEPLVTSYFINNGINILLVNECMSWLILEAIQDIYLCAKCLDYPPNSNYPVIYDSVKNTLLPQVTTIVDFSMFRDQVDAQVHCEYLKTHIVLTIESYVF